MSYIITVKEKVFTCHIGYKNYVFMTGGALLESDYSALGVGMLLREGGRFGDGCDALESTEAELPAKVDKWFKQYLKSHAYKQSLEWRAMSDSVGGDARAFIKKYMGLNVDNVVITNEGV